ncbi:GTPase activating protein for RHO [Scheffersomyces amazonensis]|uniref:GTPase activating protein for RHO n=1 Tax=Scheffersomyces amazonensis TaxID=1078765 RepID=UPI00315CBD87
MSHSSSPTRSGSILGWVKNLKKGNLTSSDSVDEVTSDPDQKDKDHHHLNLSSHHHHHHHHHGQNQQPLQASTSLGHSDSSTRSPSKSISANLLIPQLSQSQSSVQSQSQSQSQQQIQPSPPSQDFLRPILHHKSRSTNNVNRVRSNSLNQSEKSSSLRQHRDSFLQQNPLVDENSKYFGVPLEVANSIASTSVLNDSDYGQIPRVVAKCGVFLKKNGLGVEGIFRVGGSSKRVKELQLIFNCPPDFGKNLNWDGYTVHDAASIFRRYLNALPEPIIPLDMYESFRDPLRKRQRISNYFKHLAQKPNKSSAISSEPSTNQSINEISGSHPLTEVNIGKLNNHNTQEITQPPQINQHDNNSSSNSPSGISQAKFDNEKNIDSDNNLGAGGEVLEKKTKQRRKYEKVKNDVLLAIEDYNQLISELPPASKQLLLYILDLLSMVRLEVDVNLMSSRNLAAIFQPSILSHPDHDMDPDEYALSQTVVEFLIQYFHYFLPDSSFSLDSDVNKLISNGNSKPSSEQNNETTSTITATSGVEGSSQVTNVAVNSKSGDKPKSKLKSQSSFKRQHSKSFSSTPVDLDMVGYANKQTPQIVVSKKDFGISDDDNDNENENENEIDTTTCDDNDN